MPQKVNSRSTSTGSGVPCVRMDSIGLQPTPSVGNLGTPEPQEWTMLTQGTYMCARVCINGLLILW